MSEPQPKIRKGWKTMRIDMEILRDMASGKPIKDVHTKYYPDKTPLEAEGLFNRRLQKIKDRNQRAQVRVNTVNAITRQSRYVKKRLIVPEKHDVDDELTIG